MENNVFGKPVTKGDRKQRAREALNDPNAEGKREKAIAYVRTQKGLYGNGASSLFIFYNATGESLIFSKFHTWDGHVYDKYPQRVQNGQWGAFLFVKKPIIPGNSTGAVVYTAKKMNDSDCKQLLCWETQWSSPIRDNHAYCDILDDPPNIDWDTVLKKLQDGTMQPSATNFGLLTMVATEDGTSPLYEATLTIGAVAQLTVSAIPAMKPSSEVDDDSSAPPTIK